MKLVVFAASGVTGQHVIRLAVAEGWSVHALVRPQSAASMQNENIQVVTGAPTNPIDVARVLNGADAVVVCLGISRRTRSPFSALVSPTDLTSRSLKTIVQAMLELKVKRIIYVSAFGAGESWNEIPWWGRVFLKLSNVKYSMIDHTLSEKILSDSSLDWTALRPMMLDDTPSREPAREIISGDSLLKKVSREALARTVIQIMSDRLTFGRPVALVP